MNSMYCYICRKRRPTRKVSEYAWECRFCCSQNLDFIKNLTRKTIAHLFARDDKFYEAIEKHPIDIIMQRDMIIPLQIKPGEWE